MKLPAGAGTKPADALRELDYIDAVAAHSAGTFRRFCTLTEQYFDKYGKDEHSGRLFQLVLNGLTWRVRDRVHLDDLPKNTDGAAWMKRWRKLKVKHGRGCSKMREQSLALAYRRWQAVAKSARQAHPPR